MVDEMTTDTSKNGLQSLIVAAMKGQPGAYPTVSAAQCRPETKGTHTMPRTTSTPRKRPIETYEHTDKQRANNPPVGLVTPETRRPLTPVLYYRG